MVLMLYPISGPFKRKQVERKSQVGVRNNNTMSRSSVHTRLPPSTNFRQIYPHPENFFTLGKRLEPCVGIQREISWSKNRAEAFHDPIRLSTINHSKKKEERDPYLYEVSMQEGYNIYSPQIDTQSITKSIESHVENCDECLGHLLAKWSNEFDYSFEDPPKCSNSVKMKSRYSFETILPNDPAFLHTREERRMTTA